MNKPTRALSVCTLALCVTASGFMARAMAKSKSEIPASITGCVVAGEAKDSFLLTGVTMDGNVPSNAFYRLNLPSTSANTSANGWSSRASRTLATMKKAKWK